MSRGSAVRFDATGDALVRTTDVLSFTAAYTWEQWFYLSATLGGGHNHVLMSISNAGGSSDYDQLVIDEGTMGLIMYCQTLGASSYANGATTLSVGTWYHVAVVRAGGGSSAVTVFLDGTQELTMTPDVTGRAAPDRMEVGGYRDVGFFSFNGRVAGIKIRGAASTAAEIRKEMRSPIPVRRRDLNAWYECQPGRLTLDSSGRGRHMTANGTLTAEAGPPMLALPRRRMAGKAPAATASLLIPGLRLSQAILAR